MDSHGRKYQYSALIMLDGLPQRDDDLRHDYGRIQADGDDNREPPSGSKRFNGGKSAAGCLFGQAAPCNEPFPTAFLRPTTVWLLEGLHLWRIGWQGQGVSSILDETECRFSADYP